MSEIAEPDALTARARAIARTIAGGAPIAAEAARLNLRPAASMPLEKAIEYEHDPQTICSATQDAAECKSATLLDPSPASSIRHL